ncbi:MAG TPA: DNA polymerase, partial [Clostridia bacterium]|nr:DNA polymerase [Clostridia bacterium]
MAANRATLKPMAQKLFLLDGMALVYRAHFALIARPIYTSKGVNTSALYGFTQTLLDIIKKQEPTHIAVAFDTDAPTQRHADFAEYKATRQAMPEDLSKALPHVHRMLEAFHIPSISCDGWEADDLIGTLVRRAEKEGFTTYMVTPDKDFGQLISEHNFIYKPSRMGEGVEILGLPEICAKWGIQTPAQVADVLALMGDSSDNIPGVPGIGEKTAGKLIAQYGSVEQLLEHVGELSGRVKDSLEKNRDMAILSKKLATIQCDAPCPVLLESLALQKPDEEKLKALFVEFEFNSIGRRLFGEEFKAGHGFQPGKQSQRSSGAGPQQTTFALVGETAGAPSAPAHELKTIADVQHEYHQVNTAAGRKELLGKLQGAKAFGLRAIGTSPDTKKARLAGLAFALAPHTAFFVPLPGTGEEDKAVLEEFRRVLELSPQRKIGHNLKYDASLLRWRGIRLAGPLFDSMIAHALIEPDLRHNLDFLSESALGYTPLTLAKASGTNKEDLSPADLTSEQLTIYAGEGVDLALQLHAVLQPMIQERGQKQVFHDIEAPLVPVLVDMEYEGIKVDSVTLADFAAQLSKELGHLETTICHAAGTTFNLNSPKQLGQILFEVMKICEAPKKTRTGQYATDEQTLLNLASDHEIVRQLLDYRAASKLKSTYADALPLAIWPATGRIHTTYNQVMTSTGRLNSQDPNLQNIPIRT